MQSKPVVVKTGVDPVLPDDPRFGVPDCSQVTASSATVSCTFDYTGGKEVSEAYFLYGTTTSDDGQRVAVTTEPGAKSATLTGLSASTKYKFRLCVVVGGETFVDGIKQAAPETSDTAVAVAAVAVLSLAGAVFASRKKRR